MAKRMRAVAHYYEGRHPDPINNARCSDFGRPNCRDTMCPRHEPDLYVEYKAKHCPDSITPVDRDPWSGRV